MGNSNINKVSLNLEVFCAVKFFLGKERVRIHLNGNQSNYFMSHQALYAERIYKAEDFAKDDVFVLRLGQCIKFHAFVSRC